MLINETTELKATTKNGHSVAIDIVKRNGSVRECKIVFSNKDNPLWKEGISVSFVLMEGEKTNRYQLRVRSEVCGKAIVYTYSDSSVHMPWFLESMVQDMRTLDDSELNSFIEIIIAKQYKWIKLPMPFILSLVA